MMTQLIEIEIVDDQCHDRANKDTACCDVVLLLIFIYHRRYQDVDDCEYY